MKTILVLLTIAAYFFLAHAASAASQSPTPPAIQTANIHQPSAPGHFDKPVTAYTLPPDLYRKAHKLGQISFWGELVGPVYGWIILLLVLNWRPLDENQQRQQRPRFQAP